MKFGLIFFCFLLLGLVFEFVEEWADKKWGEVDLFFIIDAKINPSSYAYYTNETLERIFLALFIRHLMSVIDNIKCFKEYATAFIILESIDLIDFWMTGNTLWFLYHEVPITFNVIKVAIFMIAIIANETNRSITSNLGN